MWLADTAVEYVIAHAKPKSLHRCAEFTRRAIEAGGLTLIRTRYAKDYGPSLTRVGFARLDDLIVDYEPGDVVIINGFKGHEAGHMAMFTGVNWVSDFKQKTLYPGHAYRKAQPNYTVYRYLVLDGSFDDMSTIGESLVEDE
jgi:hypothetical protein